MSEQNRTAPQGPSVVLGLVGCSSITYSRLTHWWRLMGAPLSETRHVDDATLLDWITALGTLGAVVVAVWATIGSQRAIHRELEVGALVTRRREAMELLQAFEAIQTFRWQHQGGSTKRRIAGAVPEEELLRSEASYGALLRVSEEDLPIARGMAFRRISYGSTNDAEKAHLDQAQELGDVEAESEAVMKVRAEIVRAVEALNERIRRAARRR